MTSHGRRGRDFQGFADVGHDGAVTEPAERDGAPMTERKDPIDQAVELLVYAPLGFALEARTLLPQMVDRGRQQVVMARMVGQFAVQHAQKVADKRLATVQGQASTVLTDLGLVPPAATADEPPAVTEASPAPGSAARPKVRPRTSTASRGPKRPSGHHADELAVPGYDSLAASQVIPRLTGLSAAELEDVRAYEIAGRSRKTILNRIAQLQQA